MNIVIKAKYVDEIAKEVRTRRKIANTCKEIAKLGILFLCSFFVGSGLYTLTHPTKSKADVEEVEQIYPETIERVSHGSRLPETDLKVSKVPGGGFAQIRAYTNSYNGSRIDNDYLNLIMVSCDYDTRLVERVVAGSVCETGMGRDTKKHSNFWGYFKGGNRGYDPNRETMARVICEAYGGKYSKLGEDEKVTSRYTGGDNTSRWMSTYRSALNKMSKGVNN